MWLSGTLVHSWRRTGHGGSRAGGLRFTTVTCSISADSHRRGSAPVRAAFSLPASRTSAFFLTLDS
jgi:hypothetical protein